MKVTIEVQCDNEAFHPDPGRELARILRKLADRIEEAAAYPNEWEQALADANGNRVGCVVLEED